MTTTRQAVIVVHGMGEQSPMGIARSLADVAIEERSDGVEPKYYSRPDKLSPSNQYDLRRLLAARDGDRLQTEFYEYHWAHLMSGNKLVDLWPLVRSLFAKVKRRDLGRLKSLWNALVGLAALVLLLIGLGLFVAGRRVETWDLAGILAVIGVSGFWATLVIWASKWLTRFLTGWFADAARYWDPAPKNQDARNKIRAGLIGLLDALHESGRYDRIIIAAHSLGSVIAYDALGYSWARYNKLHARLVGGSAPVSDVKPIDVAKEVWERLTGSLEPEVTATYRALEVFEAKAAKLNEEARGRCDLPEAQRPDLTESRREYRAAQWAVWSESRCNGSPWLVTDLVSFGSPLAHASILIANGPDDLKGLVARKEWPTIPPRPDRENRPGRFHWECEGTAKLLYHGAVFGPVRWTNLWYDKDSFAGPIDCRLGPGVENIELSGDGGRSNSWLLAHTDYLKHPDIDQPLGATANLRRALDLAPNGSMPRCTTPTGKPPEHDPASATHTAKPAPPDDVDHDPELRSTQESAS